jgi:hypothetical protein
MLFEKSVVVAALGLSGAAVAATPRPAVSTETVRTTVARLTERHGEAEAERIRQGVAQAAERWWPEDGDEKAFASLCEESFLTGPARDAAFDRIQKVLEQVDGHLLEVRRELLTPQDLDTGPVSAVDTLFARYDPFAHVNDDLFQSKVAFVALLNFPVRTLQEMLTDGPGWDRRTWAEARMTDRFALRVPASVNQAVTAAFTSAEEYISRYYIRMDRLVTSDGKRPFPEGLRLISHWNLRDELKSQYANGKDGLQRQRMIQRVMERIVRQEIPQAAIDNGDVLWNPETNAVKALASAGAAPSGAREPDTRYARLLEVFRAVREADPYAPTAPTFVKRRFELDRQIPEKEVEALLVSVLSSPEVRDLAKIVQKRLGRPLEPFDIWYPGFAPRGEKDEAVLNERVKAKYPSVAAFQADLPRILVDLGFSKDKAAQVAANIVVDPARGAGHALGAVRREDKAHLRTHFAGGGMDYKGFNIAVHELGHNVEQTFSLNGIDHWFLNGVPNNAFTEALAFVFQARDLELLGLPPASEEAHLLEGADTLWATYEIGGVGLVDTAVWNWMYAHPDADAAQLREATLSIARDVWNKYYAPVFGKKDVELLAIYSHMISNGLYLPDYSIGHIIALQVGRKLRTGSFGDEFERVARQGRLTPDAWMRGAVGTPVSADALLKEARKAIDALNAKGGAR